jgi:hypothetical protein
VSTTTVKPDTVYHVACTFDGSRMRIYVNGSLESTATHDGGLNSASFGGAIAPAGWGTLPSPHFQGTLDEIAIYGHALTTPQVRAHDRTGRNEKNAGRP